MNILLINPPFKNVLMAETPKFVNKNRGSNPPMGIISIATCINESTSHQAHVLDAQLLEMNYKDIENELNKIKPEVVGMAAFTFTIIDTLAMARVIKNINPEIKIVFGGPHATLFPYETVTKDVVDIVVVGEGERTFPELIENIHDEEKLKKVNGLMLKDKYGKVIVTPPRDFIEDLDEIPIPDRTLTPYRKYNSVLAKRNPLTTMVTSRGCPYRCTFCLPPESEISTIKGNLPIKHLENNLNTIALSYKNKFRGINEFYKRGYVGSLIRLDTYRIDTPLRLTPNHRIYSALSLNEKPSLRNAETLREGNYLIIPILKETKDIKSISISNVLKDINIKQDLSNHLKKFSPGHIKRILELHEQGYSTREIENNLGISNSRVNDVIKKYKDGHFKNINLIKKGSLVGFSNSRIFVKDEIDLDSSFLRLIGYYVAEGHVSFSKHRLNSGAIGFTFNKNEKGYIQDTINLCKGIFNIDPEVSIREDNTIQLYLNSNVLASFFSNLFGKDSYDARLPKEFLYLPKKKLMSLIQGIYSGDGGFSSDNKCYALVTTSKILADQVFIILLRLGMFPTRRRSFDKEKSTVEKHNIELWAKDYLKIVKLVGLEPKHAATNKYRYGKLTEDYAYIPIKNVSREDYKGWVYNLNIKQDHSYTANWFAVSNCDRPQAGGKSWRANSVKRVVDEMQQIKDLGINEILFYDDTWTMDMKRAEDICREILERKLDIGWDVRTRVDRVSPELIKLMKKAGCERINFGVESGTEKGLAIIKKDTNLDKVEQAFKVCKEMNMDSLGYFMVGLPGETKEDMFETINFAKKLDADFCHFTVFTPFPDTEIWRNLIEKGNTSVAETWRQYALNPTDSFDPPTSNEFLSKKELFEVCTSAYKSFYFRPNYIIKQLSKVRSFGELTRKTKAGISMLISQ